jgi:hypothetical protein
LPCLDTSLESPKISLGWSLQATDVKYCYQNVTFCEIDLASLRP